MIIKQNQFLGEIPRSGAQVLPDGYAQTAYNMVVKSGELRALHMPKRIHDFDDDRVLRYAQRILSFDGTESLWMGFEDDTTSLIKAPVVNDSYNRHYWTALSHSPLYNTYDRISSGLDAYLLGVPQPTNNFSVVPVGGGTGATRAYTYTFVSEYGEEGPTAGAIVVAGDPDQAWDISGMDTTVPDQAERNITGKYLYRTVVGLSGQVDYFRVNTTPIPLATATFSDTLSDASIAANPTLESAEWEAPPEDLDGLVAHPNGFLAGFVGRDVYLSETYRPHAWPAKYKLSVGAPIVALAVYQSSIIVMTSSFVYSLTGTTPAALAFNRIDTPRPCLSRYSVTSLQAGILYASSEGVALANATSVTIATDAIITKDEWQGYFSPQSMRAASDDNAYIALISAREGICIDFSTNPPSMTRFSLIRDYENLLKDSLDDRALLLNADRVYEWNPALGTPLTYVYKTKEYDLGDPVNIGSGRINTQVDIQYAEEPNPEAVEWNIARVAHAPLNPINSAPINGVYPAMDDTPSYNTFPEYKCDVHFGPLFNLDVYSIDPTVTLRVYAYGNRKVEDKLVPINVPFRLPGGFKSSVWAFEVIGVIDIKSISFASTGSELKRG